MAEQLRRSNFSDESKDFFLRRSNDRRRMHLKSELELQQRIVQLYIEHVQRTGQIDYPPLLEVVKEVEAVESDHTGQLILSRDFINLKEKLGSANEYLAHGIQKLESAIQDMGTLIRSKNRDVDSVLQLSSKISICTRQINLGVNILLNIAEDYAGSKGVIRKKNQALGLTQRGTSFKQIAHLAHSLLYLKEFIAHQTQIDVLIQDFSSDQYDSWALSKDRLQGYCTELCSQGSEMAALLEELLQQKTVQQNRNLQK